MSYVEHFATKIVETLKRRIQYSQGDSILIRAAEQNIIFIVAAITQYVAEIEQWGPTDCTTYNSFNLAKQRLYIKYNILVELFQKPMTHPEWSHDQIDVSNYATLFIDHELNHSDPYFDTIKRDYYNDVSN